MLDLSWDGFCEHTEQGWNRRVTKKGGRCNPPSEWVWSPRPTHEPLVTKELFEAASPVAKYRQGSRTGAVISNHPQAKRSYRLRSYVTCDLCDRRMFGALIVSGRPVRVGSAAVDGRRALWPRPGSNRHMIDWLASS
jgi:hypothetical protein